MGASANDNDRDAPLRVADWREAMSIAAKLHGGVSISSADGWYFNFGEASLCPALSDKLSDKVHA